MKQKLIYIIVFALLFSSCDDYLDVEPKGKVIPSSINDYDLLLYGGYNIHTSSDVIMMSASADDFETESSDLGDVNSPSNSFVKIYRWDNDLYTSNDNVQLWSHSYNNIYTFNLVIANIDEANGEDEIQRARVKAEAHAMRAYDYFILVNSFAKQYDVTTASTDLAVPLVTQAKVNAGTYSRASVQEIYDFIIADLKESIGNLPNEAIGITRASKTAAYALLARVYLQMGDYENAKSNATMAINSSYSIANYTDPEANIGELYSSEQLMFRYYNYRRGYNGGTFTQEMEDLFDYDNDTRIGESSFWGVAGTWQYIDGYWQYILSDATGNLSNFSISHCVSISEMYLIRAECNARLTSGSIDDVLDDLNTLRRNRIRNYSDSTNVASKEAALQFALDERRRELAPIGIRWFDLKRLNKDAATAKTITHQIDDQIFTLEPNSNRYVFPIPYRVISQNPGMIQNNRD